MKKFGFLMLIIALHIPGYSQQTTSLSDFLDRDLTQILQDRIDSLSHELFLVNHKLENNQSSLNNLNNAASESAAFLLLLHRLEDSLPLTKTDSAMISFSVSSDQLMTLEIGVNANALRIVINEDSFYINNFPKLANMMKEGRLIIRSYEIAAMGAPAVELPSMPPATGNNKKLIAQAWLNYIYNLVDKCQDARDQMNNYIKKEKIKVPDGNVTNIIKLRQKFAVFIIENYCKG